MPDTTLTDMAVPSSPRKSSRSATPEPTDNPLAGETENDAKIGETARRVHFVLQGKGGVGKTLIASLLIQYYKENGRAVACYDTDPVNASLAAIPGLAAKRIRLFNGDQVAVAEIDQLMADIMAASCDVVIDNGAASFTPFSQYLIENDIATVLSDHGVQMVVHAVVAGGGMVEDTVSGLLSIIDDYPPSVRIVVWVNEYFGRVVADGRELEQLPIYRDNQDRIIGLVRLPLLNPASFGRNLKEMLERKLTFAEALTNPDFTIIPMQRLVMIRRDIWKQLAEVI